MLELLLKGRVTWCEFSCNLPRNGFATHVALKIGRDFTRLKEKNSSNRYSQ